MSTAYLNDSRLTLKKRQGDWDELFVASVLAASYENDS